MNVVLHIMIYTSTHLYHPLICTICDVLTADVSMAGQLLLETTKLTFLNISKEASMVVQCKATNKHGRVSANAYLSVLGKLFH